ncbi:alpha/beta hydrolase [Lentzea sp. NBC_00516]|uniref:alpha/beta hydrolase n=1 Tax=Lentzea sp. NBC_00516 TaxID=2903582 RepID=UPI002E817F74|nr:alpha/beta hydrolase [Lentzea sp. NBC_00516]WUD27361.1 alpha/beta hydrolase [Lentzea sp. NBC_00516]
MTGGTNQWQLDRELFSDAAVSPATRELNQKVAAAAALRPHRTELTVEQERALPPGGGVIPIATNSARASTIEAAFGNAPAVPVRVVPPQGQSRGVYVHFHGGGWAFGSAANHDDVLERIADTAGVTCLSIDYRLAPDHVFPAPVQDGQTVLSWLLHGTASVEHHDRVILGGESAGAHLACLTALWLRDRGGHGVLRGLNLSQGMYDLRLTPGARLYGRGSHVIDTPTLVQMTTRFLADADAASPQVSPLLADLRDLPPALFTVGTLDPLLEDSLFMYARWVAAGNAAELKIAPGAIHGYTFMDYPQGREAATRIERFVASCAS